MNDIGTHNYIIRPAVVADAESINLVRMLSWQAAYRGIVADAYLDHMDPMEWIDHRRKAISTGQYLNIVAESGGEVVGWISAGRNRIKCEYDSEVYAFYVLPGHQRRGIGEKLFCEAARQLSAAGYKSLMLWALSDNPAKAFYIRTGGTLYEANKKFEIGGQQIMEDGYVWPDLRKLIGE